MIVNLAEIEPKKPLRKQFHAETLEIETITEKVLVENVVVQLRFQADPLGYVLHYELKGEARLTSIRTGNPISAALKCADWIALRTQQPKGSHLVLDGSELNVRFITSLKFDAHQFVKEVIELELPAYPREAGDGEETSIDSTSTEPKKDSPFAALKHLIRD